MIPPDPDCVSTSPPSVFGIRRIFFTQCTWPVGRPRHFSHRPGFLGTTIGRSHHCTAIPVQAIRACFVAQRMHPTSPVRPRPALGPPHALFRVRHLPERVCAVFTLLEHPRTIPRFVHFGTAGTHCVRCVCLGLRARLPQAAVFLLSAMCSPGSSGLGRAVT